MTKKIVSRSIPWKGGAGNIVIETGKIAGRADGAVLIRAGKMMMLGTVVSGGMPEELPDFFPLTVDYQERFAGAGKVPGGFLKREGRPSEHEVLICRLVDRCIRPLFPSDYFASTQVTIMLLSVDPSFPPDAFACLAASAAIAVSDVPFACPVSEARVVRKGDEFIFNPTYEQMTEAAVDLMVGGSAEGILMVEGSAKEAGEAAIVDSLRAVHAFIKEQCQAQQEMAEELSVVKRTYVPVVQEDEALYDRVRDAVYRDMQAVSSKQVAAKKERDVLYKKVADDFLGSVSSEERSLCARYLKKAQKEAIRDYVLSERVRMDGRQLNEVRALSMDVDYLPSAHGSALFTRGETQALATVTLGTQMDAQLVDGATVSGSSRFMLHYNFPSFSTGETRPNRGTSRREVGHGNLAMRALKGILPSEEDSLYTLRIVSDIFESNGSSSMATVCAGSLALMDAGVQVSDAVSGIAMGMISAEDGRHAILSDILGDEDHLGDMDFKIAGTEKGITACQMDIKVKGLSYEVLQEALLQAREGRLHILSQMKAVLSTYRPAQKPHAPRATQLIIDRDMIGAVIGPGGKVVQGIQRSTQATVVISEKNDQGIIQVYAPDEHIMEAALAEIKKIITVPAQGDMYDGKVVSVMPYGAFVEFLPGKTGLLHISEVSNERVENIADVLEVGDELRVQLVGIDKKTGKYRLSRKSFL